MSSNQRLLLAVALSFVFFVGYTTIFPPKQSIDQNITSSQQQVVIKKSSSQTSSMVSHEISSDETIQKSQTNALVKVHSEDFNITIDTLGRISSKLMLSKKHYFDGKPANLIPDSGAKPLYIRFADDSLNQLAIKTAYVSDKSIINLSNGSKKLVLTQNLGNVNVKKEITFFKDGHYDIKINVSNSARYFVYLGARPDIGDKMMSVRGGMVYTNDDKSNIFEDEDVESRTTFTGVTLASSFDQYYASIFYNLGDKTSVSVDKDREGNPVIYLDLSGDSSFSAYIGAKDYEILKSINPKLTNVIEFGWFTFAAAPLFKLLMFLHSIFGNWGWAIVALTALVRLVLFPLTYKGMMSMQKIKEIAPKIKELQAKYKGDPQRMNAAVMEMYKKHGANPLGGCLPMILQIPVFFAIYRVLLNAVELKGAEWILWFDDISKMDPTYILPILMGATMFYQQKITPSNFTDPMQEKIFKFLPVIFTFFFVTFPAGLVLYWLVNNIFSIIQQFIVNKNFNAIKVARHEKHLEEKSHGKD